MTGLIDTIGVEWQQIAGPRDRDIIAEAQRLADEGKVEVQLYGTSVRARLARRDGPKAVDVAAQIEELKAEAPRPDWLSFGIDEPWREGDGLCEGHYFNKPRGQQYLWSTRWYKVDPGVESRAFTYNAPDVHSMSKTQLYAELRDYGWRSPMVLDAGWAFGHVSAQELLVEIDPSNPESRWAPDGTHGAVMNWLEQARQRVQAYISPSCLELQSGLWTFRPQIRRILRTVPWRPYWCPPAEVRGLVDKDFALIRSASRRSLAEDWESLRQPRENAFAGLAGAQ